MNIQFLNFIPTPHEKYHGIAAVKIHGIILKYKIVPTKDGKNFFPAPAQYKISDDQGDRYVPAFMLDSNSENEELNDLIRKNVRKYIEPSVSSSNGHSSASQPSGLPRPSQDAQSHYMAQGTRNNGIVETDPALPF